MGFLLSRRWLGFLAVVLVLAALAVRLGDWQFNRLDERRARNTETRTNLRAAPVPVTDVLRADRALSPHQEWRRVTVTGTWDDAHTVVIRYQTRDSGAGVDVATPLLTRGGTAVLVDRGWIASANSGSRRPSTPRTTPGEVTVTGYTRVDGTGGSTTITDLSARAISGREVAKVVDYPVYAGFVMLTSQTPEPTKALAGPQLPELDDGPHFFYGLQWWFFAALALVGFLYLAWDEVRRRREERVAAGAESTEPVSV